MGKVRSGDGDVFIFHPHSFAVLLMQPPSSPAALNWKQSSCLGLSNAGLSGAPSLHRAVVSSVLAFFFSLLPLPPCSAFLLLYN